MKRKIVIGIFVILLVAAISGNIVLGILLSKSSKQAKNLKVEKTKLLSQVISLSTGKSADQIDGKQRLYRRDFVSHYDSQPDSYVLAPPLFAPKDNKYTLLVYLHGMGSNYMEPYIVLKKEPIVDKIHEKYPSIIFTSLNFGKQTAWGNDKSISDITQNISELTHAYPVHKIILVGTSMGGSVALNYVSQAPDAIKSRITGVVSVEGTGDLAALYNLTKKSVVKLGIARAMGGSPAQTPAAYEKASLLKHLDLVPKTIKFSIVSAKKDKTVPSSLQKNLHERLVENGYQNKFIEIDTGHEFPKPEVYLEALEFTINN